MKPNFTYQEAYDRYTLKFTHVKTLGKETKIYRPQSVCSHRDLDAIFAKCHTWDQVLREMRAHIGSVSVRRGS